VKPVLAFILPIVLWVAGPLRADIAVADLGQNLGYFRPTDAMADLPVLTAHAADNALIVDLRRTVFEAGAELAWLAALRSRPAGQSVRLVLISPATAPGLLAGLAAGAPGCITIGRSEGTCHPDVVMAIAAEADSQACDELAAGTPPATLAAETFDKQRHDEVELGRLHAAGKTQTEETDAGASAANKSAAPSRMPVRDAVLERAVAIDRGLLALGKVAGASQPPSTTKR